MVSLDADQLELVLHHGWSDRLECMVGEQVVEVALIGEFQSMM